MKKIIIYFSSYYHFNFFMELYYKCRYSRERNANIYKRRFGICRLRSTAWGLTGRT